MSERTARLSKTIAHALRHAPEQYGLTLDKEGWTPLDDLLGALVKHPDWRHVRAADIEALIAASSKQRYEISGLNIRAIYGHSTDEKIERAATMPPGRLYHGTTPKALPQIRREGLKPMARQYVHLSQDVETAVIVARRRTNAPVILPVLARRAHDSGVVFHYGNDQVWLTDALDPSFLVFPEASPGE